MQIGVVGLGRMGANITRRLMKAGHSCVVYDVNAETVKDLGGEGASGASSLADVVQKLGAAPPRAVWVMLPSGKITEDAVAELGTHMGKGDIVIDGGNALWTDTIRREKALKEKGLRFIGSGVSGGEEGALLGPSIMPGGTKESYASLGPILEKMMKNAQGLAGQCAAAAVLHPQGVEFLL